MRFAGCAEICSLVTVNTEPYIICEDFVRKVGTDYHLFAD
jgi:hypothetical protein